MFRIEDGRDHFYQWDLGRRLIIEDVTITQVHFCNCIGEHSLLCETYMENGLNLVDVPNILLQQDWNINVYAYDDKYAKFSASFDVERKSKPANYIYTETEVLNYNTLVKMIEEIELTPGPQGPIGEPGPQGEPGYTPQKGIDYFDGEPGPQGEPGADYVLTDADKQAIALLAIDLMPAAEEGEY